MAAACPVRDKSLLSQDFVRRNRVRQPGVHCDRDRAVPVSPITWHAAEPPSRARSGQSGPGWLGPLVHCLPSLVGPHWGRSDRGPLRIRGQS
eukprot:754408-Hanusia_phi.AAC.6